MFEKFMKNNLNLLIFKGLNPAKSGIYKINFLYFSAFIFFLLSFSGITLSSWIIVKNWYHSQRFSGLYQQNQTLKNDLSTFSTNIQNIRQKIVSNDLQSQRYRLAFGLELIPDEVKKVGIGGVFEEATASNFIKDEILKEVILETHDGLSELIRMTELLNYNYNLIMDGIQEKVNYFSHTPSILPAEGSVTSHYGLRYHPIKQIQHFHLGIDIANKKWTPIYASADGIVVKAASTKPSGRFICINHGFGIKSYYLHLINIAVSTGQMVKRGQIIGYMGNTGAATGTHLHYEIRKIGKSIDPMQYIILAQNIYD